MAIAPAKEIEMISEFQGPWRFLSNFWRAPIRFHREGAWMWAASNEHFYQAAKCRRWSDFETVLNAPTPGAAKRLGRTVWLRDDWEQRKLIVMRVALACKFG